MENRQLAIKWWNNLTREQKISHCKASSDVIEAEKRWSSLTGWEIESIYDQNNKSDLEIINMIFSL